MRVAFHYDEGAVSNADKATETLLKLARRLNLPIRSRLYVGSLLIRTGAEMQSKKGHTYIRTAQPGTLRSLIEEWLTPQPFNWYALTARALQVVTKGTVHCNLYDTIEPRHALALHHAASRRSHCSDHRMQGTPLDRSLCDGPVLELCIWPCG